MFYLTCLDDANSIRECVLVSSNSVTLQIRSIKAQKDSLMNTANHARRNSVQGTCDKEYINLVQVHERGRERGVVMAYFVFIIRTGSGELFADDVDNQSVVSSKRCGYQMISCNCVCMSVCAWVCACEWVCE